MEFLIVEDPLLGEQVVCWDCLAAWAEAGLGKGTVILGEGEGSCCYGQCQKPAEVRQ